MKVKTEV